MLPSHHPCINTSKSFGGLSHHPTEEKTNTKKGITKKCQVTILKGSNVNWNKRIYKAHWTSTQKAYGIWWYEQGQSKPKSKTSMMSMDAIHVHVEERREHGKVGGNVALETNDRLWTVHESWCCATPPNKWIGKKSPREFIKNPFLRLMNANKKEPTLVPCKNMTHQRVIFY